MMYFKAGPKKKKTYLDGILYIERKMYQLYVVVLLIVDA